MSEALSKSCSTRWRGVRAGLPDTARGFMFSLGCIQALRCHTNTCPTGITTHNPRLQRGLVVEEKFQRVANYAMGVNKEQVPTTAGAGAQFIAAE